MGRMVTQSAALAAVDLLAEHRTSLTALAKRERVHVATVWRWTTRGCRGIRLASFSVGSRRFTTDEAFARWIAAINGERVVSGCTPKQREAAVNRAKRELADEGI